MSVDIQNKNLPAFACIAMTQEDGFHQEGLTKREYFAAKDMQGLLTRVPNRHNGETDLGVLESRRIAEEAVIMADALLDKLEIL